MRTMTCLVALLGLFTFSWCIAQPPSPEQAKAEKPAASSASTRPASLPGASLPGADAVDTAALRRAFEKAFSDDFDIADERFAFDDQKGLVWLIGVRPRKEGHYVISYECKVLAPNGKPLPNETKERRTFYLFVGKKGAFRLIRGSQYESQATPLACVGDTVLIPVGVGHMYSEHQFSKEAQRHTSEKGEVIDTAEIMAKSDEERLTWLDKFLAKPAAEFDVNNEAEGHLKVVQKIANRSMHMRAGVWTFSIQVVLEAVGPGTLDLLPKSEGDQKKRVAVQFAIAAKDTPITVLATRFDHTLDETKDGKTFTVNSTMNWPASGPLVFRVGDKIIFDCWIQVKTGDEKKIPKTDYPVVTLKKLSFDGIWPLDVLPFPQAATQQSTSEAASRPGIKSKSGL